MKTLTCWKWVEKLRTFDSTYFISKSHFEEDGTQNYLVFQPVNRYFKIIANKKYILSRQSKGLSDETIKPPATSDNSLTPLIHYLGTKLRVKFSKSILRQPKISYTHREVANIYLFYQLSGSDSHSDDPALENCLFSAVTLTKNADIDKYGYSGYVVGFDKKSSFSFPGGGFGQNVITFEADRSSSVHVDNKKKFNSRRRSNTRVGTYTENRKNVFD